MRADAEQQVVLGLTRGEEPARLREEGLHVIWPWDKLFLYDLRLQTTKETYNAISKEGVSLTATISIRFQVKHNSVAVVLQFDELRSAWPSATLAAMPMVNGGLNSTTRLLS